MSWKAALILHRLASEPTLPVFASVGMLSLMPPTATFHESPRSTRVPLKVLIAIEGSAENRTCDGETIVVNRQGALIATGIELRKGMSISILAYLTDKMPELKA